jgi:hypothetical protein
MANLIENCNIHKPLVAGSNVVVAIPQTIARIKTFYLPELHTHETVDIPIFIHW